jgi:antitoxin component YwqK of YwqJK toxin-antitoxin module
MKTKVLLLFLLLSPGLFAQTKQVTRFENSLKQVYNVLKGNKKVKEGEFKAYYLNSEMPAIEGWYHNNLKDSLWKYYSGRALALAGSYKEDKKTGIWEAYSKGELQVQYDYTKKALIQYKPSPADSTQLYQVIVDNETKGVKLDRPPVYLNGSNWLLSSLARNIRYPMYERTNGKQSEVIVNLIIDENGKVTGYDTDKKAGYGFIDVVLKALQQTDQDWLPGILNGKAVTVKYPLSVLFLIGPIQAMPPTAPNQIVVVAQAFPR